MSVAHHRDSGSHDAFWKAIAEAAERYPKPEGVKFSYGTAGFRTLGERLPSVIFRCAVLAVLRSKKLEGRTIGVMVTASHNPEPDNGVKLVDPSGEMLNPQWEEHATALANCSSTEDLITALRSIVQHFKIDLSISSSIAYARDTRPSGPALMHAFEAGLDAVGSVPGEQLSRINVGITTTPVLHYVVQATNDKSGSFKRADEQGYFERMAEAFETLVGKDKPLSPLFVDCANGVGAMAIETLARHIGSIFPLHALNTDITTPGALNSHCGADYVKTKQALPPPVASAGHLAKPDTRGCSLDGDADRLIYYYLRDGKTFRLLDGDKIAVMVALYLGDLVARAKLGEESLTVGVVQTAYANGSSTKYLKSRGIPVTCVPTGVKHLHAAAHKYDIGVYFEANGHGTVLFSSTALSVLQSGLSASPDAEKAKKQLLALSHLINQAVGDALSDMLLVEVVLANRGWTAAEWDAGYEDLPNRLLKVEVPDRWAFETTDAERKLTKPEGLQALIDKEVAKVHMGRSFVRPSGTEDCVRVYAEAGTVAEVEALGRNVAGLVNHAA